MDDKDFRPLTSLNSGEAGTISFLAVDPCLRERLMDMGFVPGTRVVFVRYGPFRKIVAVLISGSLVALRDVDASGVFLR